MHNQRWSIHVMLRLCCRESKPLPCFPASQARKPVKLSATTTTLDESQSQVDAYRDHPTAMTLANIAKTFACYRSHLMIWARRVAKRRASYRDPKPRNPKLLEKNSEITPPDPDPKLQKKNIYKKKYQKCPFLVFFKEFGVGVRGVIFEFFSRSFGFRGFGSLWLAGRFATLRAKRGGKSQK